MVKYKYDVEMRKKFVMTGKMKSIMCNYWPDVLTRSRRDSNSLFISSVASLKGS